MEPWEWILTGIFTLGPLFAVVIISKKIGRENLLKWSVETSCAQSGFWKWWRISSYVVFLLLILRGFFKLVGM